MNEQIPGYSFATLKDSIINPKKYSTVYHGNDHISPEIVISENGLPKKGEDIDLLHHVESNESATKSAFRGTVILPNHPANIGASHWAGEGGWVYGIENWPGYDINEIFEGRIPNGMGGFRGSVYTGECEIAVPARVPLRSILEMFATVTTVRTGYFLEWKEF